MYNVSISVPKNKGSIFALVGCLNAWGYLISVGFSSLIQYKYLINFDRLQILEHLILFANCHIRYKNFVLNFTTLYS